MKPRARWLAPAWLAVAMLPSPAAAEEKVLPDGTRYEGEVNHAGDPHGRGVLTWSMRELWTDEPNGEVRYEGEFIHGWFHGRGVLVWSVGYRYEGEFRDGERHGQGVETWTDGDRYEGEFRAGWRHGQGVMTKMTGERYEGSWRGGAIHSGVYTSPDGYRVTCFPGEPCPSTPSPR